MWDQINASSRVFQIFFFNLFLFIYLFMSDHIFVLPVQNSDLAGHMSNCAVIG